MGRLREGKYNICALTTKAKICSPQHKHLQMNKNEKEKKRMKEEIKGEQYTEDMHS